MPKSNLYNVAKQLYLNHTSTWVFANLLYIFETPLLGIPLQIS